MEFFIWFIVGGVIYFLLTKEKNVQDECLKILDNDPIDQKGESNYVIKEKLESDFNIKVDYVVLRNNLDKLVRSGKVVIHNDSGYESWESKTHKKNREDHENKLSKKREDHIDKLSTDILDYLDNLPLSGLEYLYPNKKIIKDLEEKFGSSTPTVLKSLESDKKIIIEKNTTIEEFSWVYSMEAVRRSEEAIDKFKENNLIQYGEKMGSALNYNIFELKQNETCKISIGMPKNLVEKFMQPQINIPEDFDWKSDNANEEVKNKIKTVYKNSTKFYYNYISKDEFNNWWDKGWRGYPINYCVEFNEKNEVKEHAYTDPFLVGMSKEFLDGVYGPPLKEKKSVSGETVKSKLYYIKRETRQKTEVYKYEVSTENNKVVGWKELE